MNRTDKTAVVERLRAALDGVPAVVLADFRGLKVSEADALRSELRAADVRFEVVKNTLIRRAVNGTSMECLDDHFHGNTAVAYHAEDPGAPARLLTKFAKDHKNLRIKAGWLDGRVLDPEGVDTLATLPGKDELRAQMLAVLVAGPTTFVRLLAAGPSGFLRLLNARAEALGENG